FALDAIDLRDVALVLHCAGPFIHTSRPMVEACVKAGAHYLDITGEIAVFESILNRDEQHVTLLPGVGFDVVPTDCLGAMLAPRRRRRSSAPGDSRGCCRCSRRSRFAVCCSASRIGAPVPTNGSARVVACTCGAKSATPAANRCR